MLLMTLQHPEKGMPDTERCDPKVCPTSICVRSFPFDTLVLPLSTPNLGAFPHTIMDPTFPAGAAEPEDSYAHGEVPWHDRPHNIFLSSVDMWVFDVSSVRFGARSHLLFLSLSRHLRRRQ